jgi:uridylate kinase
MPDPKYRRILLKLSGEILADKSGFGIDQKQALRLAEEIHSIYKLGVKISLVIGAGNIFRGLKAAEQGMDRVTGDYLGMMATVMNSIAVQDALESSGCDTRTLTAISIAQVAEPYIRRRALRHLDKNRIVIVAGGTGNPYFTTDTAAALRAIELGMEILIKGTKVDGVYDKDPVKKPDAIKYDKITFKDAIKHNLGIMDQTAFTMCSENHLPIRVFNINKPGHLKELVEGSNIGTIVTE